MANFPVFVGRLLNRLDEAKTFEVLEEVNLGQVEDLGCLDDRCCLFKKITCAHNVIRLEGQEAGVLKTDVSDCLSVLLRQGAVECLVEKFLDSLIGAHSSLKCHESKRGFDMAWGNLVGESLVQHACLGH